MMIRRLLWKDAITIKPLLIAVIVAIVVLNLLVVLWDVVSPAGSRRADLFVSIWILMPNLIALGAPALLVGSEEESGTLSWLRTLPVSWQKIVDSKFLAGLAFVAVAWVIASAMLAMVVMPSMGNLPGFSQDLLSITGVLHLIFFSVLLLSSGFATAYLFRSPVTALIVLIPVVAVLNAIALDVGHWLTRERYPSQWGVSPAELLKLIIAGMIGLVAVWAAQRLLGRRRLTQKQGKRITPLVRAHRAQGPYRPPARIGMGRPSITGALLWQQQRQMLLPSLLLSCVIAFFLMLYPISQLVAGDRSRPYHVLGALWSLSPLVVALGASWLGGLSFYGDNLRRRCDFFADRGISPTRIWWTRLLFPAVLITVLVGLATACIFLTPTPSGSYVANQARILPIVLIVCFGFGQLVGMWMQRPTLTFFAAPSYTLFACFLLLLLFSIYFPYVWCIALVTPVLLFASWRLSGRWLAGRIDSGFHWRVVGYTVLAILIPITIVSANRYLTTPAKMTEWRREMLAINDQAVLNIEQRVPSKWKLMMVNVQPGTGTLLFDEELTVDDHLESLQEELADETLGAHVSWDDIAQYLRFDSPGLIQDPQAQKLSQLASPQQAYQLQCKGIEVLLKWSTKIRQGIVQGQGDFFFIKNTAYYSELKVATALIRLTERHGPTPELAELVHKFPSRQLRYESMRIGLIGQWRLYQKEPWSLSYKAFLGEIVAHEVHWIPVEQYRADRYIDLATRRSLELFQQGLPPEGSEEYLEMRRLWGEAMLPMNKRRQQYVSAGSNWHDGLDRSLQRLRKEYAETPSP